MEYNKRIGRIQLDLIIWLREQGTNQRITLSKIRNDCFYYRNYKKEPDIYDTALAELTQCGVVLDLIIDGKVYYSLNNADSANALLTKIANGERIVIKPLVTKTKTIEDKIEAITSISQDKLLDSIYDKEL